MNKLIKILAITLGGIVTLGGVGTACYYTIPSFKTQVNQILKLDEENSNADNILMAKLLDEMSIKVRETNCNSTMDITELYSISSTFEDEKYNIVLNCNGEYGKTTRKCAYFNTPFNDCGDAGKFLYEYLRGTDINPSVVLQKVYDLVHNTETLAVSTTYSIIDNDEIAELRFEALKEIMLATDIDTEERAVLSKMSGKTAQVLDARWLKDATEDWTYRFAFENYSGNMMYRFLITFYGYSNQPTAEELKNDIIQILQSADSVSGSVNIHDTDFPYSITSEYSSTGVYGFL